MHALNAAFQPFDLIQQVVVRRVHEPRVQLARQWQKYGVMQRDPIERDNREKVLLVDHLA